MKINWVSSRENRARIYGIAIFFVLLFITTLTGQTIWIAKVQRLDLFEYVMLALAGYRIAIFFLEDPVLGEARDFLAHRYGFIQPTMWGVSMWGAGIAGLLYLAVPESALFLLICALSSAMSLLDKRRNS